MIEVRLLQAQINPHFLYNTLEAIRGDALSAGMGNIADITEALSVFFRYTITETNNLVTIGEELDNVENYFKIQQYRFGEKLSIEVRICDEEENILQMQCPKLSLQPVIENAIFHGIGGRRKPGRIQLSVRTKDNDLFIHITDNGIGIPQSQIDRILSCDKETDEDQLFRKVGIRNINRRLKLEYGDTYGIFIQSQVDSYTEVIVRSPLIYPDNMKEQGDEQPCTQ